MDEAHGTTLAEMDGNLERLIKITKLLDENMFAFELGILEYGDMVKADARSRRKTPSIKTETAPAPRQSVRLVYKEPSAAMQALQAYDDAQKKRIYDPAFKNASTPTQPSVHHDRSKGHYVQIKSVDAPMFGAEYEDDTTWVSDDQVERERRAFLDTPDDRDNITGVGL